MSYFVEPERTKLFPFANDQHWIEVKERLNAGEERRIATTIFSGARQTRGVDSDERSVSFDIDLDSAAFVKVVEYLVDWNLPGVDGKPMPVETRRQKFDALKALSPEAYRKIEQAIDAHVARVETEKNAPSGTPGSGT